MRSHREGAGNNLQFFESVAIHLFNGLGINLFDTDDLWQGWTGKSMKILTAMLIFLPLTNSGACFTRAKIRWNKVHRVKNAEECMIAAAMVSERSMRGIPGSCVHTCLGHGCSPPSLNGKFGKEEVLD